ncbi:sigma E protease regulator RseP [Neiella marina]|uniref:Zinc metalloprotease n=1 Tax=Neiella holothuriorum TaxID=2870530 RepID=A0ABS7EEZ4_9GAMM|nr:sigma E protease regulator RseP [Neiella holothuriorum]MBW8190888.1 sigma E protease regulator RseP [Neiella holothuriorum]
MFDFFWNLLFFVVALGVLITFHEFGHYWVARRCGVKVLRFSIGFGKPLFRRTGKTGTEYVVAAIPLGGYVKMLDERVDDVPPEQAHLSFNNKTVWQRIAIVAAGPLANLLLAVAAFWLMFVSGVMTVKPIIEGVVPESPAAQAGLDGRLQIVEVSGRETPDWEAVNLALVAHIGDESLFLKAQQPGSGRAQSYQLDLRQWQFDPETQTAVRSIGFEPFRPSIQLVIDQVEPSTPAAAAGFAVGDEIVAVNGQFVPDWHDIAKIIQQSPEQVINFDVKRNEQVVTLSATPGDKNGRGYLGIAPTVEPWPEHYVFNLTYGPLEAIGKAADKTWQLITLSISMIGKLITGDVSVKNLSGPISIAQGAGTSASFGFVYFLGFVALISVNIGIINLLPLPVLDGGHLLYYFIELLSGRPVPEKIQEVGFKIGSVALMMLMGLALFNDFSRF